METQFILALFQHGYKARTSTLFHLLKGKRTSSVLIYGFLFDNLRFFGVFPNLSEKEYEQYLSELRRKNKLTFFEDGYAQLTRNTADPLKSNPAAILAEFSSLDYFQFGRTDDDCWRMLQFSVQIISHLSYGETRYVPMEQSPLFQYHLKRIIKSYPKKYLIKQIKSEWSDLFYELPIDDANFFAYQFSGYHHIGQIPQQLISEDEPVLKQQFILKNRLHKLLSMIALKDDTSILKQFLSPLFKQNENRSMNETIKYLNISCSLEEIAEKRNIKISTVKDHLLEAVMISPLESNPIFNRIIFNELDQIQGPYQEWQYRDLKQKITELNYFDFRFYQIERKKLEQGEPDGIS